MRSVLALGFLIALCASANAARLHHAQPRHVIKPRHIIVLPGQDMIPVFGSPEWARLHRKDTPSYDDPSKFGG
jgi:hypothetical protein